MEKKLRLMDDSRTYGSYHRIHYKKDMLYTFFQYVDFQAICNVGMGTFTLKDGLAERLAAQGQISAEMLQGYYGRILRFMAQMQTFDSWPIEQIYGQIRRIRREVLGVEVLEQDRLRQMDKGCGFCLEHGLDQSAKKEALLQGRDSLVVALCQPEYFPQMKEDVEKALAAGHRVYMLVSEEGGAGLPMETVLTQKMVSAIHRRADVTDETGRETETPGVTNVTYLSVAGPHLSLDFSGIAYDEALQAAVDQERAVLMVYGEEGLLHCRNLQAEAIVQAIPSGYHARAMVNQLDGERACVVYVPKHFDITRWVGMTEKTKLSYWHLWQLWKDHGDGIYEMSVGQLYRSYPQYFLNVYENGEDCPEAEPRYPITVHWQQDNPMAESSDVIAAYYRLRDQAIAEYLNGQQGLTYLSTYFTEELSETSIPWQGAGQQTGILVHGIRMAAAKKACVMNCDTGWTLRQQLEKSEAAALQLFSNFLFFLTPKLAELYNELRKDRPQEQLHEKQGHLDYKLLWQDGKRVETFPLYCKAVLAKKRDGRFLLTRYRLGGGSVTIQKDFLEAQNITWAADAVDPGIMAPEKDMEAPVEGQMAAEADIQIYTPYCSCHQQGAETNIYRCAVGADRINLVIIQDKICCIRRGDVILPSIGVVISLSVERGERLLAALKLAELDHGYCDVSGLELTVALDGPAQISRQEWQQVEWAYGGGLSLIADGQSIYGGDTMGTMCEARGTRWLAAEGWLSPLSRQTQESALHVLVKHPRTAIGLAKNGDLFVLVFSGRTLMSAGADYQEMCHIAKVLIPDVEAMMNVDGGGSSVLGLAVDGHFMELSYPATSMNSCAGMVRKVNTVLCLEP